MEAPMLVRWNDLDRFFGTAHPFAYRVDRLLRDFEAEDRGQRAAEPVRRRRAVAAPVDVRETADEFVLTADVPGVAREDISIDLDEAELTLTAKRTLKDKTAEGGEDSFEYVRKFALPPGIDRDKVEAELANGVLRVRLPKSAVLKPRRIEVRAP
jgi:HSP20 family molecular chaperone IbpA